MRKLLTILLFLPLTLIGQATSTGAHGGSSSDGLDIDLVYKGIVGNADQPLSKVQVNDTIVLALKLNNLDTIHQITYIHTDVQYNSAAYALLSTDWNTPTDAQNSVGNWSGNGMKMVWNTNYDKNAVWAQWQYGSYTGDQSVAAGWQVDHIQSIAPTDIGSVEYATMKYLVKDAGANADYTENIIITMARAADNILTDNADTNGDGNNDEYVYPTGKVRAYDTQYITHVPLEDLDSNIYVKLDANGNIDLTKIKVKVIEDGTEVADLAFDTGGEVNITDYIISSTKTYKLQFHTTYTETEWKTITENAVTLSDAVLTLKEVGKFGHGGSTHEFDYGIQYPLADTDESKTINPQDAYNLLGHVIGSFTYYAGGSYAFATTFPIVKTSVGEGYTKQNFLDGVSLNEGHEKTIQSSDVTDEINSYELAVLAQKNPGPKYFRIEKGVLPKLYKKEELRILYKFTQESGGKSLSCRTNAGALLCLLFPPPLLFLLFLPLLFSFAAELFLVLFLFVVVFCFPDDAFPTSCFFLLGSSTGFATGAICCS